MGWQESIKRKQKEHTLVKSGLSCESASPCGNLSLDDIIKESELLRLFPVNLLLLSGSVISPFDP